MIPRLFSGDTTIWLTEGLGRFTEALSCVVHEERNGAYELTMVYPVTGYLYPNIETGNLIVAQPNDTSREQPFRIYKATTPLNGKVTIYAQHISYDLAGIPVLPFTATGISQTLTRLRSNAVDLPVDYRFSTDIENTTSAFKSFPVKSVRACLGGSEGSVLDTFSGAGTGEFEWDVFDVKLHKYRGTDTNVTIEYGKNMTDFSKQDSNEQQYTGVLAYWQNDQDCAYGTVQYVGTHTSDRREKIYLFDATDKFESRPTGTQLNEVAASYRDQRNIGMVKKTIQVSFIPLWNTVEYQDIKVLEHVSLCDTVTVRYPELNNLEVTMKVVETEYNVLMDRYNSITLGEPRSTLADTINSEIDSAIQKSKVKNAVLYVDGQTVNIDNGKVVVTEGGYNFNLMKSGLLRPFNREGWGTTVVLQSLNNLDSTVGTVFIITGNNASANLNTLWLVRRNSDLCVQLGGQTGQVTVTSSNGTITVKSNNSSNIEVFFMAVDGSNV